MLEVVREYATERLVAVPEEGQRLRTRHTEHFLALLVSQESRLKGPEQPEAIAQLAPDERNLAAAWQDAAANRRLRDLARAAMGLFLFCDMTSRFALGRELFRAAADAPSDGAADDRSARAYLRGLEAWFTDFCDARASKRMFGEVLGRAAELPLNRDLAFVRVLATFSSLRFGASLRSQMQEAIAFFDERGHAWESAAARDSMTNAVMASPEALEYIRESLEIREEIGDRWGIALGRYSEGAILHELGDLEGAIASFAASADLRRSLGLDAAGLAFCYIRLGRAKAQLRRPAQARRDFQEAERIATQIGYSLASAQAYEGLAGLEAAAHRIPPARQYAKSAAAAYLAAGYADRAAVVSRMLHDDATSGRRGK
jgi:tetratricopeptide (TPR) repeat protein